CWSLLVLSPAWAEEATDVKLEWQPRNSGFSWYLPQRITLSPVRPATVQKIPDDVTSGVYATLSLGPKEAPQKFVLLIDEPEGKPQRLWADSNGNGDLTDDGPTKWEHKSTGRTEYSGSAKFLVAEGAEKREFEFTLYRFNKTMREDAKTSLFGTRAWAWTG